MAIHGFDIAVGMTPDACSKRVNIFTVAAQYALSQEEIDSILSDEELDSYLFTFGEAAICLRLERHRKLLQFFRSVKMLSFSESFPPTRISAQQENQGNAWLG